ncbi:ParB/RepB/Spo0J family partition protein [Texcoconibacillus texcoconensis]|uniref:ParB-like chromosome segregation protein Spo0J n=1 Tax=Texcoconibacillus texcoconensis TaxID=1095777 RepID=A0A840QTB4_9BACI|nr:ParB/RepB/Spo0J family partition protein [Texcoconibacillus texcoconensis]MBB5174548.1 ParB-like chromosome segregation protein Spo0J [Texcoconibacillus texcoconensis]
MKIQTKTIKLSQIKLETSYRKREKDLSLELSINRKGLIQPLIVEQVNESQYILVDGYRRYFALEFLERIDADCIVEELSSEEERIVKRLGVELHNKKRTGYELEKMINRLLENNRYDEEVIARLCNVKTETIRRHASGRGVNPDWIRRGEKTGAGRHGFTVIHHLKLNEEHKNDIADEYIARNINKNTVDHIKKATKEEAFQYIPENDRKPCIDQIVERKSTDYDVVKEIVNENSLLAGYSRRSHTFMHNLTLDFITRIEKLFKNNYYVNYLSKDQKEKLTKSFQKLILYLNPPIKWDGFPKDEKYDDQENEDDQNLEH